MHTLLVLLLPLPWFEIYPSVGLLPSEFSSVRPHGPSHWPCQPSLAIGEEAAVFMCLMGGGKEAIFSCPCEQRAISPNRHLLQASRRSAGARSFLEDCPEQGQLFLVVSLWKSTQPVFTSGFRAGHWPVCSPQTQGEAAQALLFPQSRSWEEEGNILYSSSHPGGISKKLNWEIKMTIIFGGNNCVMICLPEKDNMGRAGS